MNQSDEGKPTESAQQDEKVEVGRYTVDICTPCVNLEGEECHTPGCIFFLCGMAEVREYLTRTLIRPTVDGELLPLLQAPSTPVSAPQDGILEVLRKVEEFIEQELTVRKQSFLPEGSPYIDEAQTLLDLVSSTISNAKSVGQEETKK